MLHYPKISGSSNAPNSRCIAFEKYDGTNMHWDWDRDFRWHAFGTRRDEFNLTDDGIEQFIAKHAHLQQSVKVFYSTLADKIADLFSHHQNYRDFQSIKVFTEFFGENSFAGLHKEEDLKELRLFDVQVESRGMIGPKQFCSDFGHLHVARVVYEGKLTGKFAEDVRIGKYAVSEGVICKGGLGGEDLWMAKIKTYAYMERLKKSFSDRWEEYWES